MANVTTYKLLLCLNVLMKCGLITCTSITLYMNIFQFILLFILMCLCFQFATESDESFLNDSCTIHLQGTYALVSIFLCLYHLFRLVCPFFLSDNVVLYQLVHSCLCSLTLSIYLSVLSLFSHCVGDFWERPADWGCSSYQLSRPPTPHYRSTAPGKHVTRSRAPRELSLGQCLGLCLYSLTFLPVQNIHSYIGTYTQGCMQPKLQFLISTSVFPLHSLSCGGPPTAGYLAPQPEKLKWGEISLSGLIAQCCPVPQNITITVAITAQLSI